ncbi:MAG TPA: glycosyltransferase family 4 protein [Candidatus Bathyarchaeia archaeon]|nr:glycosyltransferase family 4 protein [Candidatus Bathyarchaeia archaeon]
MKITFLCPHLRIAGGVRAILTHADRLAQRGHEVTLQVPAKGALAAWWRNRLPGHVDWMPGLRARVHWVPEWSAARVPAGDVVVATSWQSVEAVAAAPVRCGRKFYFIQHYESLYHGEAARVDATYRVPLRKIVISTWLADVMAERFDTPAAVIVTPVDPAQFHPVESDDDGKLRVLMLFHEYPWKGVADGLEAFARVRSRHPNLLLVGFGLKAPPRKLPFAEFHQSLPQARLAWLYSRCPVYLCPSWDEGLGMPAMEAMACGSALCTYDNGGCRDYAIDGRTAVVAPRRDLDALAWGLSRLVEDAELRRRVARQGQQFVATQFDWERATARLEALLAAR